MSEHQTELPPRMDEFLEIERGTVKAESTINQYRKGLKMFSRWLDAETLALDSVSTRDIKRYLTHLKEKDYAHNTVRLKFAAVSQFYDDLVDTEDIEKNPTDKVKLKNYAPKVTKVEEIEKERLVSLSKEEFNELVKHAPSPRLRNRLLIMLQYYTALRRQEIADIRRKKDLNREERQIKVRGKRDKIHTAHYQPRVDGLLARWIEGIGKGSGRPHTNYVDESPYLFPTDYSEKIGGSTINDVVVQAAKNAGIQEVLFTDAAGNDHYRVTSHTLRHSFAMHYLQEGGSIEALSKLLAHSSVVVTEIYGEIQDERASNEYEEFAPDPLADSEFNL